MSFNEAGIRRPHIVRFGPYEFHPHSGKLTKHGIPVHLQEIPSRILRALVENPGSLVPREKIVEEIWPGEDLADQEHSLNAAVNKLRAALNDLADHPRYIETIPRRGYRYTGPAIEFGSNNGHQSAEGPADPEPPAPGSPSIPYHEAPQLCFEEFQLDPETGELSRRGIQQPLAPQPAKVLALLAGRAGQLFTRETIRHEVWGSDTFVDFEQGLNNCIKAIRKALDDDPEAPRYIQTVPRRGYRFLPSVHRVGGPPASEVAGAEPTVPTGAVPVIPRDRLGQRWHWMAGAVLVLLAVSAFSLFMDGSPVSRWFPSPELPQISSIAVLPFENLSHNPEETYFVEGMTDALITTLGGISALRVISRQSTLRFRGSDKPLPAIARELNVDAIVGGSVQRSGSQVRISAHLIHGKTDRHVWAANYERDFQDLLRLQGEVAQAIAKEINVATTPDERKRLQSAARVEPEAYKLYLQGRHLLNQRTLVALEQSILCFRKALEIDPEMALAFVGLSESYGLLPFYRGAAPNDAFPLARAAAQKALQIDNSNAEAHAALGFVYLYYDWNWESAEREITRAIQLKPNYEVAHHWHAEYLSAMDRREESSTAIKRALELDPLSPLLQTIGAEVTWYARRYDVSADYARRALLLDPDFWLARSYLLQAAIAMGMRSEAATQVDALLSTADGMVSTRVAHGAAKIGRRSDATAILQRTDGHNANMLSGIASVHLALGDTPQAVTWLEKAYEHRDPYMTFLKVDPRWDPIRSSPRFQEILRRMNFPD
jgi:DNA-binding winged helix-turn-helix (wHTH) protein/TolB-like protein/Tfp pilus assembly protein PilF